MTEEFYFISVSLHGQQKLRKIRAETFELAKEKAIEQFNHIKYFKQKPMDLQSAIERAKKSSKAGKAFYINVDEDGECAINTAPLGTVTHKFVNGVEDKTFKPKQREKEAVSSEPEIESPSETKTATKKESTKQKTKEIMATKSAPKKVSAKKIAPAKKSAVKPAAKKANGQRKMYGIGISIVEAIKKAPFTMDQLVKKFEQSKANVSFHLSLARANGVKVENTDKGYKVK